MFVVCVSVVAVLAAASRANVLTIDPNHPAPKCVSRSGLKGAASLRNNVCAILVLLSGELPHFVSTAFNVSQWLQRVSRRLLHFRTQLVI